MTMQQNRPLVAIPNVLRDETIPNRLAGMGMAHAPTVTTARRSGLPIALMAILIGAAIALAVVVTGQS